MNDTNNQYGKLSEEIEGIDIGTLEQCLDANHWKGVNSLHPTFTTTQFNPLNRDVISMVGTIIADMNKQGWTVQQMKEWLEERGL